MMNIFLGQVVGRVGDLGPSVLALMMEMVMVLARALLWGQAGVPLLLVLVAGPWASP
jgi:hypothetical protein